MTQSSSISVNSQKLDRVHSSSQRSSQRTLINQSKTQIASDGITLSSFTLEDDDAFCFFGGILNVAIVGTAVSLEPVDLLWVWWAVEVGGSRGLIEVQPVTATDLP